MLVRFGKLLGAIAIFAAVAWFSSDDELWINFATLVLAACASGLLFFASTGRIRVQAAVFLGLVLGAQHGVNYYFWHVVWSYGWPWPWKASTGAVVGSIAPFVGQVADTSFTLLALFACIFVAVHLTRRSTLTRKRAG